MSKLLVKFNHDCYDEYELNGFKIYANEEEFVNEVIKSSPLEDLTSYTREELSNLEKEAREIWDKESECLNAYGNFEEFYLSEFLQEEEIIKLGDKFYDDHHTFIAYGRDCEWSSISEFLYDFTFKTITDEEADVLINCFGLRFGAFPVWG